MLIGDIKKAIRNRCNNSPALTYTVIENYVIQVMTDLSLKAQALKSRQDVSTLAGIYEYLLGQNILSVNKIEYGTTEEFAEDLQRKLIPGKDYELVWLNPSGTAPGTSMLKVIFTPEAGNILRIYTNDFNDASAALDLSDPNDAGNLNAIIAPVCEQAIIDGAVAFYKVDFERNPTSQISIQKYSDTLTEVAGLYNERVENP